MLEVHSGLVRSNGLEVLKKCESLEMLCRGLLSMPLGDFLSLEFRVLEFHVKISKQGLKIVMESRQ